MSSRCSHTSSHRTVQQSIPRHWGVWLLLPTPSPALPGGGVRGPRPGGRGWGCTGHLLSPDDPVLLEVTPYGENTEPGVVYVKSAGLQTQVIFTKTRPCIMQILMKNSDIYSKHRIR